MNSIGVIGNNNINMQLSIDKCIPWWEKIACVTFLLLLSFFFFTLPHVQPHVVFRGFIHFWRVDAVMQGAYLGLKIVPT